MSCPATPLDSNKFPSNAEVDALVSGACKAHPAIASLEQEQVDTLVEALHKACLPNLEYWAKMAVEETGFGNVADKTEKNRFAAEDVYRYIQPLKTTGVLKAEPHKGLYQIAWPYGVVAAILPSTNPTSTAIYKIMIALKARCAIVVSPHPYAKKCIKAVCDTLRQAIVQLGYPGELIGCIDNPSIDATQALMVHKGTDVILSTGGPGIVRAAYSSGKPAYGVGAGNVPVYVDSSATLVKAVRDILTGKTFDYGTICASEQAVVADAPIANELRQIFLQEGGYFCSPEDKKRLEKLMITEQGTISAKVVGKSAEVLADLAGIKVPPGTRCLLVDLKEVGRDEPLSMEKLSCVLGFYVAQGWKDGCKRCIQILRYGGMGHTLGLHCADMDIIRAFALEKPAFRIVVNSPTTHGAIGHSTGVAPAMTLGCGTAGNNITSDNITPLHLVHRKYLAFEVRAVNEPPNPELPPLEEEDPGVRAQVEAWLDRNGLIMTPKSAYDGLDIAVDFVSEGDARQALSDGRKIPVDGKTIITPAARDYGNEHKVFRFLD